MGKVTPMNEIDRRSFIKSSGAATAGTLVGAPMLARSGLKKSSDDTVRVAIIGIHGRGKAHCQALAQIPDVHVATLCDIDQRLLPEAAAEVESLTGIRPETETEFRKVLDDKSIDAVTIATPNHWHALQTIWACQAGKDVYVEKPVSHNVLEGRRAVEAARKYNRVVQSGMQGRSSGALGRAIRYLREGGLGDVYMAKGLCLKPRGDIGRVKDGPVPEGVDWNTFLGPAPFRPFNQNRYLYKWHWFWDTGNGDLGNQGVHQADFGRWSLDKMTHPVRIQGAGNKVVFDNDQETPNIQHLEFEYSDGKILQFEVRGLGTNPEGDVRIGNLVFGSKGWMKAKSEEDSAARAYFSSVELQSSGFSSYREEEGPVFALEGAEQRDAVVEHFANFIQCVRSRNMKDLHADILEGHLSSSLCHLGNIATRLNRTLQFDPEREQFVNDSEADTHLTRNYRSPFLLPGVV